MKAFSKTLMAAVISAGCVLAAPVHAADKIKLGVTLFSFDDNFLSVLRNSIEQSARDQGVDFQVEDAKNEIGTQLNQIQNFIAAGVDAIIVDTVDSDSTRAMTDYAKDAGIPLVFVGRRPINVDSLPDNQAFVASNEDESGTLQTQEVCRLLGGKGDVLVMMGTLGDNAAVQRTADIHKVLERPECKGMKIVEEQTADFMRTKGNDLMTNWLTAGLEFDAIIANNDEMAIGAIQALKADGRKMDSVVIAGIDATADALTAMQAGDLDVTVFQNAAAQGRQAVEAAVKLVKGVDVDQKVWVPFELVTPANMDKYIKRN
ncbi:sugar ABC transporter substrate-binding protein [Parathalassolituus penaei]|uniref:Sugar ABC transporter substrate-binding protein n=1 Tax=Parathalassolituus penaei TaxID=2997323 RepID=A0A9X3ECI7_9GAMM|nr:sugar ABC transporter substrate-binding protein [Parathalassolituus penaei]MCY0964616.1 sugar ABC transporter substrate-binding protein [Parathalassolituus penaei]